MKLYQKLAGLASIYSGLMDSPATKKNNQTMPVKIKEEGVKLVNSVASRLGFRKDQQLKDYCRKYTKRMNQKELQVVKKNGEEFLKENPVVWKQRYRKIIFAMSQESEYSGLPVKEFKKLCEMYVTNDYAAQKSKNFGYRYGFNMRFMIKESFSKIRALSGNFLYSMEDVVNLGRLVCKFVMNANKDKMFGDSFYDIDWTKDYSMNEHYRNLSLAVIGIFTDECNVKRSALRSRFVGNYDLSIDSNAYNALYTILNPHTRELANIEVFGNKLQTPVLAAAFFLTGLIDKNMEYIYEPYTLYKDQQEEIKGLLKEHF